MTRPYEPNRSLVQCEVQSCPRSDPHLVGQTRCTSVTVWTGTDKGWRSATPITPSENRQADHSLIGAIPSKSERAD